MPPARMVDHLDFEITDDGASPLEIWFGATVGGSVETIASKNYLRIDAAESAQRFIHDQPETGDVIGSGRRRIIVAGILRVDSSSPVNTSTLILKPTSGLSNQLIIKVISGAFQMGVANNAGTPLGALGPAAGVALNADHWFELLYEERGGVIYNKVKIAGTEVFNVNGGTAMPGSAVAYWDFKSIFAAGKGASATVRWRNMFFWDGDDGNWDWPPTAGAETDIVKYTLTPDGNPAASGYDDWTASAGTKQAATDDFPAVVGTDYISETTVGQRQILTFSNPSLGAGENIYTAMLGFFYPNEQSGGLHNHVRAFLQEPNGGGRRGWTIFPNTVTDYHRWRCWPMDRTPDSGVNWRSGTGKSGDINDIAAGVILETKDQTPTPQVDALNIYLFTKVGTPPVPGATMRMI